jgi:hypothetical protein
MNTLISQFPKWLGLDSIAIEYLNGNKHMKRFLDQS